MNKDKKNSYTTLSLGQDRFAAISLAESKIVAMESRELVHRFGLISFQEDARDLEVHRDTLENLVQKYNLHGQKTGIVIGEDMVLVKRIPVALGLDEATLKDHLEWEAKQILLSPLKDFRLVYERLPAKTAAGNPYYLMVLMRKLVLHSLRTLIESIGLRIHEIEVDIFSHLRALHMNYKIAKDDIITLIRIQASNLLFIFIAQGEYLLSHRIEVPKMEQIEVSNLGAIIKKELRRLVFGHRLGRDLEDLKKLFVQGSLASDGLIEQLKTDIPVTIEKMNPLKNITLTTEVAQSQEVLRFPDRFTGTIGLLLKSYPQLVRG